MLRLTAVLLVALYAVMSVWGAPPEGTVEVARADTISPSVPALAAAPAMAGTASTDARLDVTEAEAVQLAIAATATRPAAQPAAAVAAAVQPQAEAAPQGQIRYVTGARVNLRAAPTTNSAIVGGLSQGDRAELLSDPSESWVRIRTDAGVEAWIFSRFLAETPA